MQRSNYRTGETEPLLVVLSGRDLGKLREFDATRYPHRLGDPYICRRELTRANAELTMDEVARFFRGGIDTIVLMSIGTTRSMVNEVRSQAISHPNWRVEWRAFEFLDEDMDCATPVDGQDENIMVCPVERRRKPRYSD